MNSLVRLLQALWKWILSIWQSRFGPVLTMEDSGIRVRVGSAMAEGGFSVILHATCLDDAGSNGSGTTASPPQPYVLKRIRCHDGETRSGCLNESKVHYAVMRQQQDVRRSHTTSSSIMAAGGGGTTGGSILAGSTSETIREALAGHVMPLLGTTFCENHTLCYMLFPRLDHSLRSEVEKRIFEPVEEVTRGARTKNLSLSMTNQKLSDALRMPPWPEATVLRWFEQLCDAVLLLHGAGYTHRDIKLDNVLMHPNGAPDGSTGSGHAYGSGDSAAGVVLMDYGSAGPLTRSLATRRDVLEIADEAAQHTTVSYRPPELFAGELRVAPASGQPASATKDVDGEEVHDPELVLDYRGVDVWMLGCTLFAVLFGASPGESEFSQSTGQLRVVDPGHSKVLGTMPPWPPAETNPAQWYSEETHELLRWILTKDRANRPTLKAVRRRVRELLLAREQRAPDLFAATGGGMASLDIESQL